MVAVGMAISSFHAAGCRPAAEGNPMTVEVGRTSDGSFVVRVPICGRDDGIGRFDLSFASGSIETRGVNFTGDSRIVGLEVNAESLGRTVFNPAEVEVLEVAGDVSDVPSDVTFVFVSTSRGFASWDQRELLSNGSPLFVTGRSVSARGPGDLLDDWC
jgi:hypothetical protein